jgi:hypothetical protein
MVLYDPNAFHKAEKFLEYKDFPNHKFEDYLYKFKSGFDKSKAVVGVVKILRE